MANSIVGKIGIIYYKQTIQSKNGGNPIVKREFVIRAVRFNPDDGTPELSERNTPILEIQGEDRVDVLNNFKKDDNLFFLHNGNYYGGKIVMNRGGIIMLRLQKSKFKEYELDYKRVTLKEEPSSLIIIDNRFEQQRILIE